MRAFFWFALLVPLCVVADNSWDLIDFVTRWTGTACVQSPKLGAMSTVGPRPEEEMGFNLEYVPRTVTNFTIHGAWPDRKDGTWPQFCDPSYPFNWNEISDMKSQLDSQWPSFTGSNPDFYKHEWEKHGTCSQAVMGKQHQYFQTTLGFNSRWNLYKALTNGGYIPSFTKAYSVSGMNSAISRVVGKQTAIQCGSVSGKQYFVALHICFDKALNPMDCPAFIMKDCASGCSRSTDAFIPPVVSSCYRN